MNQTSFKPGNWRLLPLLLLTLLLMPFGFAQETTAGIQGTIKDPSGASIANATVEVSGSALIGMRKVQSDATGNYRFAGLPSGSYVITATAPGFRTYKQPGIELAAGRLPTIDVQLQVGALAETVEVTGSGPIVDVTQSKVSVTVEREMLNNIPKGRSFQSVIPFAAGARMEPMQGSTSGRANGFQIDGASDSENVYLIDGVNTTNIQNGGVGRSFQMEFIQEVQIKSSSFEAEFGGALGGVINAVPKRGSNDWHGSLLGYLTTNKLNAIDPCSSGLTAANFSTVCGLRLDPTLVGLNTTTRLDGTPQYYTAKKDHRTIVEPGFTVGGSIMKDRLWIFSAYNPAMDTIRRITTFTGLNPGPRELSQSSVAHNAYNRLDYRVTDKLRLFGSWNYAYFRTTGTLGQPDALNNIRNAGASTDPNTLRADAGSVQPNSVYSFGGDYTPTSKLVITSRLGYFFNNIQQRGVPVGTRYVYQTAVNANTKDLQNNTFPASSFNTAGFANIPSNLATLYDAYKRTSWSADASYFVGRLAGSHTFKGGYFIQTQQNSVLTGFNGGRVDLTFGQAYAPVTSATACDGVIATNKTLYGSSACQGKFGYFTVGTGVVNTGGTKQYAHAIYFQDAWNVGHGLTLNLGIRFDQERQPPYDANRFPSVEFGWGEKIAPRIGGAYDLLHNGKVKIYASYGKFFDIMKMGLARGSFGSDYWHNCIYAMDDTDFTKITPSLNLGGGCPATGPAPGVSVGRFIENVDFRATKADPRDPAIDPKMKPMEQHEYVMGVDWAITPQYSLEARYSRKRLDRTIEDMSITDNLGFYIGNPGTAFNDFLHRPVVTPNDAGTKDVLTTVPFCAECPGPVKAIRRYDGLELRLAKRSTGKWSGTMSYTYSRLTGNYSGLTDTDPTDGGGGRHAPNNGRAFDLPSMGFTPSGKQDDGPLPTDRPHTGKANAYYTQKWLKMSTIIGFTQAAFQGSPLSTCLPVVGTSSACQWAEGRGNWVDLTRAANGDIVKGNVTQNARLGNYFQSDLSLRHEIPTGRENVKMAFEANVNNLLNQHAVTAVYQFAIPTNLISPSRKSRFDGDPGVDWGKVMNGYNYVDALNGTGAFAGVQSKLTLASRYGLPQVYQGARVVRLALRFTF